MTDREWDLYIHGDNMKVTVRIVEYKTAEYNALLAQGFKVIQSWSAPDGSTWVRLEGATA